MDSDVNDCIYLGTTSTGTPVSIFRPVVEADKRICLGNIEYHYFAGYSGGAKAILPGVSTRDAIQKNHSMMVLDEAKAGAIDTNPLRQDIDEVAKFLSIDFILNVVLDEKKNIIKAIAGHYLKAHREGCQFLDNLYKVTIKAPADIVIVSPGGYPKDINLYQAQKALDNAKHAVREGGVIILVASCKEGLGEHVFERWMTTSSSPDEMIVNIQHKFELGGHKAAAIAMVLKKARVFLVSDLENSFVRSIFLEPYKYMECAINDAMLYTGKNSSVLIMPYGGSTLPVIEV
jgi:lactate racemase